MIALRLGSHVHLGSTTRESTICITTEENGRLVLYRRGRQSRESSKLHSYSLRDKKQLLNVLRGHLYRRHKEKPRCVRCWLYFQNDEYLKIHLKAETICPIRPEPPIESVTSDMITRLRCRRHLPEAEEERWKAMYQIIFPDTEDGDVPSPCE